MNDPTENTRRDLLAQVNTDPGTANRAALEVQHGADNVWDTDEVRQNFEVLSFAAPFVVVIRRSNGTKGTLCFRHSPRYYYDFRAE